VVQACRSIEVEDVARPSFAVSGSGASALRAAIAVFSEGKPRTEFRPDEEISIVFFSEPSGQNHVRIASVKRQGERIVIEYRLEPYFHRSLSQSLALIPAGKLHAGKYQVEMRQLTRDQKYIDWGLAKRDEDWSRQVLSKPFSFTVAKNRE
jgi:hypothetical protein